MRNTKPRSHKHDPVIKLTPEQKAERDARAQYWMNQRKIEAVAEGAWKGGWDRISAGLANELVDEGHADLDEGGELVLIVHNEKTIEKFRVEEYDEPNDQFIVRRIETIYREKILHG